jgi:hypothetical protein
MNYLTALRGWRHFDKVLHTSVGAGIGAAVSLLTGDFLLGVAVVNVAAWGKEWYDQRNPARHTPDPWDAVWTVIGGAVGAGPAAYIHNLI